MMGRNGQQFSQRVVAQVSAESATLTKLFASVSFVSIVAVASLSASLSQAGTSVRFARGAVDPKTVAQSNARFYDSGSTEVSEFVIQFQNKITNNDKAMLEANQIRIFRFIPDDALIVRATAQQLTQFQSAHAQVRAFMPYKGVVKISDTIPNLSVFSISKRENILVSAFTADDAKNILAKIQSADSSVQVIDLTGRHIAFQGSVNLASLLADMSGVEFIQRLDNMKSMHMDLKVDEVSPVHPVSVKGDYSDLNADEGGTKVMNFESAWAQGFKGSGQIAAMADTGLDSGDKNTLSPDFKDAVKSGFSYGMGAISWNDPMGHGTHVAGSVVSRGVSSNGMFRGGAYEAMLIGQGMWSPILDNLTVPPKLVKLFDTAYNEGARVHTNSWGSARNFGDYDSMAQQVDEYMWAHPDFLILFAAGNSGVDMNKDGVIDPGSVSSPGTAKNCLTVGASENTTSTGGIQVPISKLKIAKEVWSAEPIFSSKISDNPNGMAMFSSRGPATDKRIKPEISAPGTNILSNRSPVPTAEVMWGEYNQYYVFAGGTSMATPLTAGAAILTREILAKRYGITNPSAALIKATLVHTAFDMYPGQYGEGTPTQELKTRRPNSDEGYGRVDMKQLVDIGAAMNLVDEEAGLATGEKFERTVQVVNGKLLANLMYTDAPGTPAAGKALVNNLDLELVDAQGAVVAGNHDTINNNEIIELSNLPNGNYTLRVVGLNVPMGKNGKQPFALVYTAQ